MPWTLSKELRKVFAFTRLLLQVRDSNQIVGSLFNSSLPRTATTDLKNVHLQRKNHSKKLHLKFYQRASLGKKALTDSQKMTPPLNRRPQIKTLQIVSRSQPLLLWCLLGGTPLAASRLTVRTSLKKEETSSTWLKRSITSRERE